MEAMEQRNEVFVNYVSVKLLKRLGILAEYNRKSKDDSRGRTLFGANAGTYSPLLHYINTFNRPGSLPKLPNFALGMHKTLARGLLPGPPNKIRLQIQEAILFPS